MEKQQMPVENKMGTMPVGRLLFSMSVPMMISMIVQALYNVVDSIFVAQLSENALTSVSLAFPIQNLMIAVAAGLGVGINALLSRSLGQRDSKRANKAGSHGVLLLLMGYLIFLCIGLFGAEAFMRAQTDIEEIIQYGTTYLRIVTICSIGLFMQFAAERLLQATGNMMQSMVTQLVGAIINIILDPIMIFGLLGCPAMGIGGAALATVIGQMVAAVLGFVLNSKYNHEIKLSIRKFKLDMYMIRDILFIGVPSIIMQAIGSLMNFGMNQILIAFSSTAVAVFGVYFKLQSFIFMPVFGLNNGMVPIIAYNYGAGNKGRMVKTIKLSMITAVSIMLIGFVVFQTIPEVLLGFFEASPEMLRIGVPALRTISYSFIFAGFCIIGSSVFQALGNSVYSMIMSIGRQIGVLLPAAYILSRVGGLDAVWWAFGIAEFASVGLCIYFLFRINRKVLSKI